MIEENWYRGDGKFDFKRTYKYDNQGFIIEENWFSSDGRPEYKRIYRY